MEWFCSLAFQLLESSYYAENSYYIVLKRKTAWPKNYGMTHTCHAPQNERQIERHPDGLLVVTTWIHRLNL